jgi:hypothetical protein
LEVLSLDGGRLLPAKARFIRLKPSWYLYTLNSTLFADDIDAIGDRPSQQEAVLRYSLEGSSMDLSTSGYLGGAYSAHHDMLDMDHTGQHHHHQEQQQQGVVEQESCQQDSNQDYGEPCRVRRGSSLMFVFLRA